MDVVYGDAHDPALPFGCAFFTGVDREAAGRIAADARASFPAHLEDNLETVQARVDAFDAFFRERGHRCPLPGQLASAEKKGLRKIDPFVDVLLYCELTTGLLMGVQDSAPMQAPLVYDTTTDGEAFAGMRGPVRCTAGEIVVRDGAGVVASYFQGPDFRTRVTPKTTDLAFFAFAAPGLGPDVLREGLDRAVSLLGGASESADVTVLTSAD